MTAAPAPTAPTRARNEPDRRPFDVGERLTYEVRFGPLAVGTATMQVLDITTVRGIPAFHTRFEVRGGNRLYRVQDRYESWFDTRTLASLRYVQDIREGNYERHSVFEIFPSERRFVEEGKEPERTVEHPLDEVGPVVVPFVGDGGVGADETRVVGNGLVPVAAPAPSAAAAGPTAPAPASRC